MLIENLLPVIPSEIILPLAGFEAAKGTFGASGPIGASAVVVRLRHWRIVLGFSP